MAYGKLAGIYDIVFGPILDAGRREARHAVRLMPGDHVLEVGVGTGLTLSDYPPACHVTGIDLAQPMLEQAARRLAARRLSNVELLRMDAAAMRFPDASFDVVYAAYVMSTVQDPQRVIHEMRRVCRRGGYIVILNHFLSHNPIAAAVERLLTPLTDHIGFRADLDLRNLLANTGLQLVSERKVNRPPLWTLVVCRR